MVDREKVKAYALQNAQRFKGTANPKPIMGKILSEDPAMREHVKELQDIISEVVDEVNAMSPEEQEEALAEKSHLVQESKQEGGKKDGLKELKGAENGVVMRIAPSPSGPFHIGHAVTGALTSMYVHKYGGRFIVRIEDTDANSICPDTYKMIPEDADWVFGNVSEVWVQSDRMDIYYRYIRTLLEQGSAYVCTCDPDSFKQHISDMQPCPCRGQGAQEHLRRWERMQDSNGYAQGEAVLRFASDMAHKNPAMRDFPLARINETEHPRQGNTYRVWPLMNLAVVVDDIEAGMTHVIRGKDHMDNAKRQELVYQSLGRDPPYAYFMGRINFTGLELSCSKTLKRIRAGEFCDWDDIRLPFLRALRRRGYQPEVFRRYAAQIGLSPADKSVEAQEFFKSINAMNRDLIEPKARRFFFIEDPVHIDVEGAPSKEVELPLHPEHEPQGRHFETTGRFMVNRADLDMAEGDLFRLMDCCNVRKEHEASYTYVEGDYHAYKEKGGKRVLHWLPAEHDSLSVRIAMPDGSFCEGYGERHLQMLSVGDIIQFERFGFCRLDNVEDGVYTFWFTHK